MVAKVNILKWLRSQKETDTALKIVAVLAVNYVRTKEKYLA